MEREMRREKRGGRKDRSGKRLGGEEGGGEGGGSHYVVLHGLQDLPVILTIGIHWQPSRHNQSLAAGAARIASCARSVRHRNRRHSSRHRNWPSAPDGDGEADVGGDVVGHEVDEGVLQHNEGSLLSLS